MADPRIPNMLHEAPLMAFGIFRPVGAVARVFLAIVLRGRLFYDFPTCSAGRFAVRIDRIHPDGEHLCVGAAQRTRTLAWQRLGTSRLPSRAGNHNYSFSKGEFRVLDTPALSFDFQPHLKTKRR